MIKYTEVRPPRGRNYDCLWDIAERYLGEGRRYKEIYELNKNKLQPDGRRLTNPDLILPGWQVRLPADAKGASAHGPGEDRPHHHYHRYDDRHRRRRRPAPRPPPRRAPRPPPARVRRPAQDPAWTRAAAGPSRAPSWFVDQHRQPRRGPWCEEREAGRAGHLGRAARSRDDAVRAGRPGSRRHQGAEPVPVAVDDGFDATQAGIYGFGATLLAAGLALALKRRRGWALGPGPKSAGHRQTEVGLRLASDIPTAQFVDNALRQLGAEMTQANRPMPKVVAALVTDRALTLVLDPYEAQTPPPAPWQIVPTAPAGRFAGPTRRVVSHRAGAVPTLVTIGRNADGATVLVDLDTANGIVSFGG